MHAAQGVAGDIGRSAGLRWGKVDARAGKSLGAPDALKAATGVFLGEVFNFENHGKAGKFQAHHSRRILGIAVQSPPLNPAPRSCAVISGAMFHGRIRISSG